MKKLRSSLPAKVVAILLCTALVFACTLSGAAFIIAEEAGYYEGERPQTGAYGEPIYQAIYAARGRLAFQTIGFLGLFLLTLVFLLASAGHRRNQEGITLNLQDRIPLDLYLCGSGIAIAVLCGMAFVLANAKGLNVLYNSTYVVCLFGLLAIVVLLALALLMTLAARIKAGKWWRNSVIYRLGRWILKPIRMLLRALGEAIHAIPLIWKAALCYLGLGVLYLLLCFGLRDSGFAALLFMILNVLLFTGLCLSTLQMQKLKTAGQRLAAGDLQYTTDTRHMYRDFREHGDNLNRIGEGMSKAVEERLKSERLKTELITNVSHDLKTPLTSIINYTDLLQKEPLTGNAAEYAAVLSRQAARLKKLTDDLFDAAKAQARAIPVDKERTDLTELCNQALAEYAERFEEHSLTPVMSEGPAVHVYADGKLLWRVLDNLFSNVYKYAQPGTRVYIDLAAEGSCTVKNVSERILNIASEELTERFVRGDASRSTEGSGLGLNIAKSLMEMMGGSLEIRIDGDLFKVILRAPLCP